MRTGQDAIAICKGCSRKTAMGDLRYDWKSGDFVCPSCQNGESKPHKEIVIPNQQTKIDYVCQEGGYKFSRNEGFTVTEMCFFCGKDAVIKQAKAKANSDVIKELEDGLLKDSTKL